MRMASAAQEPAGIGRPDAARSPGPLLCLESSLALLIGVLFGIPAVVLVPPVVTYDGPNHYLRALQVSEGQLRAERFSERAVGGTLPVSHADFLNTLLRNYYWGNKADYMDRRQWEAISGQYERVPGTRRVEFTNTAIYSPVNYAFQALGMRLADALSPSPLLANWLGCLFNLAGYLLVVVLAIECTPRFRRGLLLLSASPLLILQAASLSADAVNFALPLLVLAWAWRLRVQEVEHPAGEIAGILALGLLAALLKPTLIAILPCLLLVPARRFGGGGLAKVAVLLAYFLAAAAVWHAWNRANFDVDVGRWYVPARETLAAKKQWFHEHPLGFARPFLAVLSHDLADQWPHFYGDPGDWVPRGAYSLNAALSLVFLAGFLGCASWSGSPNRAWAAAMLAMALAQIFLTALALWLAFGSVGMPVVPRFVGRYLFVPVLGIGMAWAEMFHGGFPRARSLLFWAALAANAAGLAAIVAPAALRAW
jgi:hypothetical protein